MHESEPPSSRDVEDALRSQRKLLARLTRTDALGRGDVAAALRQLTEVGAQIFRAERTSVWRLERRERSITCVDLFERSRQAHSSGLVLGEATAPSYFRALAEERSIAAHDACRDPRTRELRAAYLDPLRIGAMLDAPVFLHGEMAGVVCVEHVGSARQWHPWEELVAGNLADFVALALEAEERASAEAEVRGYRLHLESLVESRTAALEDANRALRRSEHNLRELFEASPVALILTRAQTGSSGGTEHVVRLANARAAELFGVPPPELEGLAADELCESHEDRARLFDAVREAGRIEELEVRLRARGRENFWAAVSARRIVLDGDPYLLFGVHDLTPQKAIEERLRDLATRDALTGAYNRRHFFDLASAELERARRYGRRLALAMIDVDLFKAVNDRHGHLAGDDVLRGLAAALRRSLRAPDVLARYGGEEFVVLLPETDLEEAARVVERLRLETAAIPLDTLAGPIGITISGGVVALEPGEDEIGKLLGRADEALYAAKAAGRNRIVAR